MKFTRLLILLLLCCLGQIAMAAPEPLMQVNVYWSAPDEFSELLEFPLDITGRGEGYFEIFAERSQVEELRNAGYHLDIIHEDVTAFYQSRMQDKAMGAYKTLAEINNYIDSIIALYPNIISSKISIGTTGEGRDIWAFKISDNPTIDEDEPEVLYTACIHAREVITPEVLFYFIKHLTDTYGTDPELTELVDGVEMWFVPLINPDGYYYNEVTWPDGGGGWRKNRRDNGDGTYGVDLNRNFGYQWGYDRVGSDYYTSSFTYRGPGPFSEPETQALRDMAIAHDFAVAVHFHSKGDYFMYPWEFRNSPTEDYSLFQEYGDSVTAFNGYISGQTITTLYPVNGGAVDWFYGEQYLKRKTICFLTEVGTNTLDGFWPPADRIPILVEENLQTCLMLARNADRFLTARSPNIPAIALEDSVGSDAFTISWSQAPDAVNPTTAYELTELTGHFIGTEYADNLVRWDYFGFTQAGFNFSPPYSFYSGYEDDAVHYLQSKEPYSVQPGDTLTFKTNFKIETHFDYAYVEISTDGSNFTPIPGNITTNDNPIGNNRGNGITGGMITTQWQDAKFDLSAFVGQFVYIRFTYDTDGGTLEQGIYIDDISPIDKYALSSIIYPVTDTF